MLEDATAGTITEARPRAKPLVAGLAIPLAACVAAVAAVAPVVLEEREGGTRAGLLGAEKQGGLRGSATSRGRCANCGGSTPAARKMRMCLNVFERWSCPRIM